MGTSRQAVRLNRRAFAAALPALLLAARQAAAFEWVPPRTIGDVTENLGRAVMSGALFDPAFWDEASLRALSGASRIGVVDTDPAYRRYEIREAFNLTLDRYWAEGHVEVVLLGKTGGIDLARLGQAFVWSDASATAKSASLVRSGIRYDLSTASSGDGGELRISARVAP